jgi:tetratricopeptide (TPR) repeat protein
VALKEDDEVARIALEDLVMDTSAVESSSRSPYAAWHFDRGAEFEQRSFFDKAIVEYRRGLEIDPSSKPGRTSYAELLRKRGLPAKQLEQLRFLADIGKADTPINDAIETYASLLSDSVSQAWKIDQYALEKRPYKLALFYQSGGEEGSHAGGRDILLRYLRDFILATPRFAVLDLPAEVSGPSEAFRRAREANADYYLLLGIQENERDVQLGGDLRVARTGSLAVSLASYRTGNDKIKEASVRLVDLLVSSLSPRGSLLKRREDSGLVDLGSQDGLKVGDRLLVLKKGSLDVAPEGLGPSYPSDALVADFTVSALDEEVCEGSLKSSGFFDTINTGDEVLLAPPAPAAKPGSPAPAKPGAGTAPQSGTQPAQFSTLFTMVRGLR